MLLSAIKRIVAVVLSTTLLFIVACRTCPYADVPVEGAWESYRHEPMEISFRHPPQVSPRTLSNGELCLDYRHDCPVRVVWVSEREARERGLWAGHEPVETLHLGSAHVRRYAYDHQDGAMLTRTDTYVRPHRGKLLGVEFRERGLPPDARRRLVASIETERQR